MKVNAKSVLVSAAAVAVTVLSGTSQAKAGGYVYVSDSYSVAAPAYYVPAPAVVQPVVQYRPVVQYQPVVNYQPVVQYAPVVQPAAPVVVEHRYPPNYYHTEQIKGNARNGKYKYKVYRPRFLFGPEKVYEYEARYKNGVLVDVDEDYDD